MKVKSESEVAQSCPTLRDPMDCSLPGSSIHGIFQASVLEWGATAFSKCWKQHYLRAKTWKQLKCLLADECIKKMWYTYIMEYCSAIKRSEIMPSAAAWIDLEMVTLSEVSQTETSALWYHLHVGSKMTQMNWFMRWKLTHRQRKQPYGYQRRKGWERGKLGVWD